MKLTLNIDDELLERVVAATNAKTKTEAIHHALKEVDRRKKLVELLAEDDFGMSATDWRNAFDENSLVEEDAPGSALRVAETPTSYASGRKPRSRR